MRTPAANATEPRNTVFRNATPVAFIDWDFASPAPTVWDVSHAAWQFVPLIADPGMNRDEARAVDLDSRLRLLCDAYGPRRKTVLASRMSLLIGSRSRTRVSGRWQMPANQRI
jgi:hypothetical protein